jgi:Abnormal spindle-like microcephaly-assoc'd, ASPM-SPD-2-Hydin
VALRAKTLCLHIDRWGISLALAASFLFFAGCGGLSGGSPPKGAVSVANASLNFGSVAVGSSATLADSILNNTSSSVTVTSVAGVGSGFQVTGITLPMVLAAGQTAAFSVTFKPVDAGDPSLTVAFEDPNAQTVVSLSVTGEAVTAGILSPTPSPATFGSVTVGSSKNATVTLSNTGGSDLTITQATLSGAGFTLGNLALPLTLHSGDSTSATVTFAPPASGSFSGNVTFTTTSEQVDATAVLDLSGTGDAVSQGTLSPNPASLSFNNVAVGSSSPLSETLTNTGGASATITQASSDNAAFSITGLSLPLTLAPNQSTTLTVTFKPASSGATSGTLAVVSNASDAPLNIALSGTGTGTQSGTLAVSPTSLPFGKVIVGSSLALGGTLTASGASVTVSSATLNSSEFTLSGISLPTTIADGKSASFTVTFTPQSAGASSASLSFASNASNSPALQSLDGTGEAPTQHTVDLTWDSSEGAIGYNIYRSAVSGGPYAILNSSLDGSTAYTDNTVISGQTYYYVATAVNANQQESGYSTPVQAAIPNP